MKHDPPWERLIEHVNDWASAREVPGGLEITFETTPGVLRTVEVVVTAEQWADYISTIYGTYDPRATPLRSRLLAAPDDAHYLVYDGSYDWQPSGTRDLPEDDFDPGPGEWVVTDAEGNITGRFKDFDAG